MQKHTVPGNGQPRARPARSAPWQLFLLTLAGVSALYLLTAAALVVAYWLSSGNYAATMLAGGLVVLIWAFLFPPYLLWQTLLLSRKAQGARRKIGVFLTGLVLTVFSALSIVLPSIIMG